MIGRTRSRAEEAPPGADDDPYALYLRWVEAGRPPIEEAESAARPGFAGDPEDLAIDDEAVDDPATAEPRAAPTAAASVRGGAAASPARAATAPTAAATPSAGHVNATGAAAAITPPRRGFWPFRRR
ncbi:hypothetical protein [Agromyces sp. NPDC058064]|uniref:hypothetical protein n=1 Tax=Agromyces sp. NPDC058064 TaxID=3346322 RepID=UPI0036DA1B5B